MSPQLPTFIAKVLYTICLIWANSKHYNTPSRVIVILQEFCNQVMDMVGPLPAARRARTGPGWRRGTQAPGATGALLGPGLCQPRMLEGGAKEGALPPAPRRGRGSVGSRVLY